MTNKRLENMAPWYEVPDTRRSVRDERSTRPRGRRGAHERGARPGAPPLRHDPFRHDIERCGCGKLRFPSEQAAKNIVLEARIARVLQHNHRRREDRHYRCRYGGWHTTSQPPMTATRKAS